MVKDPVHQGQLYAWRAGQRLRSKSLVTTRIDDLDVAARERFFDAGSQQVAKLAARIEAQTGCTLESRRVLDFGCGVGRMALPLAERCEHVYGIDVSPAVLREADSNARRMRLSNVEWMETDRLAELSGRYDLLLSMWVFQHIPSREGEQILGTLLGGLLPGGVGAIHLTLRPIHPLAGLFRWTSWSGKSVGAAYNPFNLIRGLDWSYPYMLMNSYSLNRIGKLLADAGVTEWHVKWDARVKQVTTWRSYDAVTIIFRKDS